mgnify:CR=1 FL=1
MSKKRIHEMAKEYGMSGKELAGKLRDLGFTHVKSHMTALDEFEELSVQGVLEAHGYTASGADGAGSESDLGAGVIRRKKKKKGADEEPTVEAAPAVSTAQEPVKPPTAEPVVAPVAKVPVEAPAAPKPAATPEPAVVEQPATSAPQAAPVAKAPVEAPAAETQPAAPAPAAKAPAAEAPTADPAPGKAAAPEPEVKEAAPTKAPEPTAAVASEPAKAAPAAQEEPVTELIPEAAPAPAASAPAATEAAAPEAPAAKAKAAPGAADAKKKKAAGGPAGKVVGFIDLSKIQAAPKKSESRRLRSRDDVLPDVRPTLRHDTRNNMLRGDRGSRGQLTAAQLREREAGRYKRHQRGGQGGRGRGDRGRGRPLVDGSPFQGQTIQIEKPVTVKKLAEAMSIKGNQLLKTAFNQLGFGAVNITTLLDDDTAHLLADEFEVTIELIQQVEAEEVLIEGLRAQRAAVDGADLTKRNPTVAFLGHVDHGKTTLIDHIRSSQVAEGEHGGITQHIGAYRVTTDLGHHVTIIDTPGHAAFTGMRVRGAKAVDVVVLVVAADAGVQPQTEEALAHAKAANVPFVIAMNKIDRAEANTQKTLEQLSAIGVIPEEWGGETAVMPVSGITGEGIQDLLERIFLESDMLELDCHPEGPASGVVLEAEIQQGKGIVAHLLVQDGSLERGNVILAGEGYGRVRSMHDDFGNIIEKAGPSVPVEVSGLSALPGIGEPFHVVTKLDEAKKVAEERARKTRASSMAERRKLDNVSLLQQVAGPTVDQVNVIIRGDVQGTVEVLKSSITEHIHDEVEARVLQAGVGAVTENDVLLASTSNALIVAFNVATGSKARQAAERSGVDIRNYNVLYSVVDDIHALMEGRLAPEVGEEVTGHVEIRRLFRSSKIGNIAGSYVLDGTIHRDNRVRLMRDDQVIFTGALASLKRESEDAKEVREGFECGLVVRNYNDIREGDVLESFKVTKTKRTLDSPPQAAN